MGNSSLCENAHSQSHSNNCSSANQGSSQNETFLAFNTNNRFLHPPIKLDFFPPIEEETAEINIHSDIIKASQHKFNNIKQENYSNPIPSYYYYKEPTQNLISNKFSEPINLSPPKILEERPLDKNSYQFENVKRADNMKSPLQYKENYSAIYSKSSIDTPYTDFLLKQRDRELNLTNEVNPQFYLNYEMFNSFGPTSSKPNYQNLRKELELESIALQFKAISDARNSPEYKEEAIALREIEEAIRNMLSTDDQLLVESMSKQDPNELEEIVRKIMNEKERRRKSSEIKEQNEMEEIVKMIILEKNQKENNFKNKTLSSMPQKDIFMDNESSMFPNNNTHKDEILNNHNHLLNESLNLQNEIKNHDPTKFPKEKFLSKKNSFDKIKLTSPLGKKSNLKIKPAKFEDLEEIFYHSPQSLQKSIVISPNGTPIKAENTPKNEVLSEIKPEFNDIFENLVTIQGKSQDYFEKSQEEIVELHGPIELLFEKHGENVNLVNSETKGRISYKKNSVELNLKEGKEENGERKKSKTMENPQGKIGMSKENRNSTKLGKLNEKIDEILSRSKSRNNSINSSANFIRGSEVELKRIESESMILSVKTDENQEMRSSLNDKLEVFSVYRVSESFKISNNTDELNGELKKKDVKRSSYPENSSQKLEDLKISSSIKNDKFMKETAKINDNKTENCEVLKNDNMKKNEEIIKKKILDEEEEDDGDNMFINHKFNKRDSYSVQMDRMKKNKGKVFVAEEKIDEELNESEVDLKKWGNFSPNKKKKRGSYFAQIKKQKTMKKMVRFIVSPKENSKKKDFVILETEEIENFPTTDEVSKKLENSNIEELSNNSKKIEENQNLKEETSPEKYSKINENSIKHSIKKKNQPKKASSMKERTDEKASLNQELINESNKNYKEDITINNEVDSVETRNRVSLVILKKENEKSGSSSEEEAVKNYKKWDSFTPQKKRKKPASLANKKAMIMKKNSMRPLNFKSDGLYQENVL